MSVSERRKKAIFATIICSILANAFSYLNLMPHHDAINHTLNFAGNWELSLGRFFLVPYGKVLGNIYMPWVNGVLSIFFLAVSVCIICTIYNMKKTWQIVLVAGLLTTNYAITELCGTFSFVLGSYTLSLCLACIGCYLTENNSYRKMFLASVCFFLSLGLYQAYITTAMVLYLGKVLLEILDGEKIDYVLRKCLKRGLTLAIAAVGYIIIYKMLLYFTGIKPADSYNSISGLRKVNLLFLYYGMIGAMTQFIKIFFAAQYFGILNSCMNVALLLVVLLVMIKHILENLNAKWIRIGCCIVGILIFPILAQLMCIFMGLSRIYFTASYAVFMFYPICVAIIGNYITQKYEILKKVTVIASGIVLVGFILYSNGAYSLQKITYDRTMSISSRIAGEINNVEGYIPGETSVILIGRMSDNAENLNGMKKYDVLAGFTKTSITYPQTFASFFRLMGDNIKVELNTEKIKVYSEMERVKSMTSYPQKGYYRMIDDVLVIKFSDKT